MQITKTVQIGTASYTLKELPVRAVWQLFNSAESGDGGGVVDQVTRMLHLACPELTTDALLDLYPSEIQELWEAFKEVNAAFLGIVRQVGLDRALIGAANGIITNSIGQFASLSLAATVPQSGATGGASS